MILHSEYWNHVSHTNHDLHVDSKTLKISRSRFVYSAVRTEIEKGSNVQSGKMFSSLFLTDRNTGIRNASASHSPVRMARPPHCQMRKRGSDVCLPRHLIDCLDSQCCSPYLSA
jgi:hypothetical protein